MKKIILITAFVLVLSCKSDVEKQLDEYELRTEKLKYLNELMKAKQDLEFKERIRIIDSFIIEEKRKIDDSN